MKSSTSFVVPAKLRHLKKKRWRHPSVRGRRYNNYTLQRDVLEWCKTTCKKHWFIAESGPEWNCDVSVHFYDPDEAMLFKLTWL